MELHDGPLRKPASLPLPVFPGAQRFRRWGEDSAMIGDGNPPTSPHAGQDLPPAPDGVPWQAVLLIFQPAG